MTRLVVWTDGVRPDAGRMGRRGAGSSQCVFSLRGWRVGGSEAGMAYGHADDIARDGAERIRSTSTIFMPRSCICWGSITRG